MKKNQKVSEKSLKDLLDKTESKNLSPIQEVKKTPQKNTQEKAVHFFIPAEKFIALKMYAVTNEKTVKEVINEAIDMYLEKDVNG